MFINIESEIRYAIEPQHTCSLAGAYLGVLHLKDAAMIAHASPGCGFAMRYGLAQHWKGFLPCPVTNVCEEHVIMGSEELLYEAILKTFSIHKPKQIFVLTGCSTALIQEDYEAVAYKAEKKIGIPIICIATGGIIGDVYYGYNSFLEAIVKKCSFKKNVILDSVKRAYFTGIFPRYDMHWRGDCKEISDMFMEFFDIKALPFLFDEVDYEQISEISSSDFCLTVNPRIGKKTLENLSKKSGCKFYISSFAPIGIQYTSFFLQEVAEILNMDLKVFRDKLNHKIEIVRSALLRGFDFAKVMYSSAKMAVIGEPSQAIPLINFFANEMGITPVMVAFIEKANELELMELERVLSVRKISMTVLNNQDNSFIKDTIIRSGVNLVFGRSLDRIPNSDIVHITWQFPSSDHFVIYDRPIIGFNGAISLVDYIVNAFSAKWY